MRQAGIFIGVDKTGNLHELHDAAAGARRMHAWAVRQGMEDKIDAHLIVDQGQKVTPDRIFDAIQAVIDGPGVDQLIVYFAGHGVNINRNEHWLLSDAPVRANAAVNVTGSVDLARYSGIPYVVFISDACRVAPEGIQAQSVSGQNVFPNEEVTDEAQPVDQFFACRLGRTAAEIKDAREAAGSFRALYTSVLLDAFSGRALQALQPGREPGDHARYLWPEPLGRYLKEEVPRQVAARGLAARLNQTPEAFVMAHDKWLARFEIPAPAPPMRGIDRHPPAPTPPFRVEKGFGDRGIGPPRPGAAPGSPSSRPGFDGSPAEARRDQRDLVREALSVAPGAAAGTFVRAQGVPGSGEMAKTAARVAEPFGPDHHETECGVKVLGARIIDFLIREGRAEFANGEGTDLRVHPQRAESVLLTFAGGIGNVVPVVPGFLTALTFDGGELIDVALEPSAQTWLGEEYRRRADEVRSLRGIAAAASREGRFRLEGPGALAFAQRMQYAKGVDPALALYAAYAYHDLQQLGRLREMSHYLWNNLDVGLFDVAMLANELRDVRRDPAARVVPFVPLLAQGWALVESRGVRLPASLARLQMYVRESLWSLYDPAGVALLRSAMQRQEVR